MKKILLLLCAAALTISAIAKTNYPQEGKIAHFTFDKSGVSSIGNYYFSDKSRSSGVNTSRSDLNKYIENGSFIVEREYPMNVTLEPINDIFANPKVTFVVRFKLPEKESFFNLFYSYSRQYRCKIDKECKIHYISTKRKDADHRYTDEHIFDLGIKKGEWTTLAISFDVTTSKVSFAANGMTNTIDNPGLNAKFANSTEAINIYFGLQVPDENHVTGEERGHKEKEALAYIDEVIVYDRLLSSEETALIAGVNGKLDEVESEVRKAKMNIIWQLTVFQMLCAVLIILYLIKTSKRRLDYQSISEQSDEELTVYNELKEAFSYWGFDCDAMGGLPLSHNELTYPQKRKYLNKSLACYRRAAKLGSSNQGFVDAMNIYVDAHNSSTRYIFNCKWWVFSLPVFAVYFKEMLSNSLSGIGIDITQTDFVNLPDGIINQFLYFTHYYLPTVLFSAIVCYFACYGERYHSVRGKAVDDSAFVPQSMKERVYRPILWILIGMAPGLGFLPLIFTIAGLYFLGRSGEHIETYTKKTTFSGGGSMTESIADPSGAAMYLFLLLGVILAVWLAAAAITYIFHFAFLYFFIKNHVVRKFF